VDLPVVECSWRAYRRASHKQVELMKDIEARAPRWGQEQRLNLNQVPLPGPFAEQYLEGVIGPIPGLEQIVLRVSSTMTAYSAYRRTKIVYRLNDHLAEGLLEAKWPGNYPLDQLRLPRNGMVIELPSRIMENIATINGSLLDLSPENIDLGLSTYKSWNHFICYYDFDLIQDRDGTTHPRLFIRIGRLGIPGNEEVYAAGKFALHGFDTLDESWLDFITRTDELWTRLGSESPSEQNITPGVDDRLPLFRLLLNAILYIHGSEDVVAIVHPGLKPTKSAKNPDRTRRFQDLAVPRTFEVGSRYGAIVERWELEEGNDLCIQSKGNGSTVRPHIRAAHSHLYWTGPGRELARVRFLPPIKVKGGVEDIEAPVVVVKRVR